MGTITTDPSDALDPKPEWFDHEPLALRDDVELIVGADDTPLLFCAERGTYTRVSRSGTRLVELLDGSRTGAEIVEALSARGGGDSARSGGDHAGLGEAVSRFFTELRQAHVLTLEAAPEHGRERIARSAGRAHILRLPLTHSAQKVLEPLARAIVALPRPLWLALLTVLWVASAAATAGALLTQGVALGDPVVLAVVAIVLVQIAFHEMAHALVCQLYGVPVRAAGVGLLFYFVPVAYVDRTDAYRLRRRTQRVAIALAGPANDLLWAGAAAGVVLLGDGAVADTAKLVLIFEVFALLSNLNPLLPTDGYHAVEAATGELNFRSRALAYTAHRLTRHALPSNLDALERRRTRTYLAFGTLTAAYFLLLFTCGALAIWQLVL